MSSRRVRIHARLRDEPDLDALVVAALLLVDQLNQANGQPAPDSGPAAGRYDEPGEEAISC